ncbi:MAG: GNAT family N-acetyltransferase [Anaerolineales bacterium]|jgi:diamine N-acetyltransferase
MIQGKRIRLRAIERSDLPRYLEWLNDPEVTEGLWHYLPLSMDDEAAWFEKMRQQDAEQRPLAIEIRENQAWRLVGNVGLLDLRWANRSAELGIFIGDKSVWDKGYGTEAVELMLQHAFDTLNLHRVFLRVFATNKRAQRSYEKAGFVSEGTLRQAVFRHGLYVDMHIMGILRPEWRAAREGQ